MEDFSLLSPLVVNKEAMERWTSEISQMLFHKPFFKDLH